MLAGFSRGKDLKFLNVLRQIIEDGRVHLILGAVFAALAGMLAKSGDWHGAVVHLVGAILWIGTGWARTVSRP